MALFGTPHPEKPAASRYLLIGGSNCVLKDGFGAALQARVPGIWTNRSLGNSPSLRGVEFLLNNLDSLDDFDHIVFEYTLNDLIFEVTQTIDPLAHLAWLRTLLSNEAICAKLVFLRLHGQGASNRLASGHSFVLRNYLSAIDEFGARSIDLFPVIAESVKELGAVAVFKDGDHFSPRIVNALAAAAAAQLVTPGGRTASRCGTHPAAQLCTLDPLQDSQRTAVGVYDFRTSLVSQALAELRVGSEIKVASPGGLLVGLYGLASREAGCLRITHGGRDYVKSMRHRFGVTKPYLAMRHLSLPIPTAAGDEIIFRHAEDIYAVSGGLLDHTLAEVINAPGEAVHLGPLHFLVPK
jgi:hypothetical protein